MIAHAETIEGGFMTEAGIILAIIGIILSGAQLALYLKDKRKQ
jgi:hypothetical protein